MPDYTGLLTFFMENKREFSVFKSLYQRASRDGNCFFRYYFPPPIDKEWEVVTNFAKYMIELIEWKKKHEGGGK